MSVIDHDSNDHDWESCETCVAEAIKNEILAPDAKPHLSVAEQKELDTIVERLADAVIRALIVEVDDPIIRRLVAARVAHRFGLPRGI